jgi:hypothetical protein
MEDTDRIVLNERRFAVQNLAGERDLFEVDTSLFMAGCWRLIKQRSTHLSAHGVHHAFQTHTDTKKRHLAGCPFDDITRDTRVSLRVSWTRRDDNGP